VGASNRVELVGGDADVLGDCDGLDFVEHAEPVAFLDTMFEIPNWGSFHFLTCGRSSTMSGDDV
jgi:hypothetical protein